MGDILPDDHACLHRKCPRYGGKLSGTSVTEAVYRKQIRPVITGGAEAMDGIFG